MKSTQFEGWNIHLDGVTCGRVKITAFEEGEFKGYGSVDISINEANRGRHIGRVALQAAIEESSHIQFVATCRKTNEASIRMLKAVGFEESQATSSGQRVMIYHSSS